MHLDILGHGDYPTWHDMVRANYAEVMERSAAQLLAHGVTTARDAGGELKASVPTRDRIARGEIPGPRLLVSGGWIQNWPEEQARRHYRRFNLNAHTAEDATRAAASLFDGGADFIKAYTGLTLDQMRAITAEAHRRGKRVGAHVYTDEEIRIGHRWRRRPARSRRVRSSEPALRREHAAAHGAAADSRCAIHRAPGRALSRAPGLAGAHPESPPEA